MASEVGIRPDPVTLAARANVARLTLQVRAALRQAEQLEAAEQEYDDDIAAQQLRARLAPRILGRRRALDDELASVRAEAAAAVADAHNRAAAIIAQRNRVATWADDIPGWTDESIDHPSRGRCVGSEHHEWSDALGIDARQESWVASPDEAVDQVEPTIERVAGDRGGDDPSVEPAVDEPIAEVPAALQPCATDQGWAESVVAEPEPEQAEAAIVDPVAETMSLEVDPVAVVEATVSPTVAEPVDRSIVSPAESADRTDPFDGESLREMIAAAVKQALVDARPQPEPPRAGLDAESLAQVLAVVMATTLDHRLAALPVGTPQPWTMQPVAPTMPVKKSFWADSWHADVLLSVLAMIIVLVVLVAWST
jgi:hypothetical protein